MRNIKVYKYNKNRKPNRFSKECKRCSRRFKPDTKYGKLCPICKEESSFWSKIKKKQAWAQRKNDAHKTKNDNSYTDIPNN